MTPTTSIFKRCRIGIILFTLLTLVQFTFGQDNYLVLDTDEGDFTMSVAVGDIDGDGDDDIVAGNYRYPYMEVSTTIDEWDDIGVEGDYQGFITVYWNDGGTYTNIHTFNIDAVSGIDCIDLGDYDHDENGYLEILIGCVVTGVGDFVGQDKIYKYVSHTEFLEDNGWNQDGPYYDTHQIKFVDFDCDGDLDVATLEWQGNLRIYENDYNDGGSGISSQPIIYNLRYPDRPDYNNPSYEVKEQNSGGPPYTDPMQNSSYNYEMGGTIMEWGDIDQDGDLDVYINNEKFPTVFINMAHPDNE